ncbi:hypothetical protein LTR70_000356 [Exophiala xenobiotica]|uniref:Uncharacterized protein n=1 Tax=Lithohypha guttulata TaxID=1690604 RepID=A0ABR0KPS9_9EURO|nr:hypothetical protein LTR24_000059 [Lithohypha guttulata]KAK5330526.1 hypothetical protein LTR70_000356 [Exophiala xenobiotica]
MGEPTVNGDMPHSVTIDHVTKYPVVSDSISAFQSNPYGQKSIDITNFAYSRFVKPTFPYLEKPASYAKPYVAKVDELGNTFLTKFDERVPIVKSETSEIKKTAVDYVNWPVKVAVSQKDYYVNTYSDEYEKCGGNGVVAGSKALVSGSFVVASDWLAYIASLLQQSKEVAKSKAAEAKAQAQEGYQEGVNAAQEKSDN